MRPSEPQTLADDVEHDFVGATVDSLYPRIPPEPGDLVFVDVAVPAVQLKATVDDPPLRFGCPPFCACCLVCGQFTGIDSRDAPVHVGLHHIDLGLHLGKRMAIDLEGADGLVESLAVEC